MTIAPSDTPASVRVPGRGWTVRLTGHSDRSASVTCTATCRMPGRSRDIAALRRFAAQHAVAHARAATVRPNASCHCRAERCEAHPGETSHCAGGVVMILRHDPVVGRVWIVEEVCETCAPLIAHARVLARAETSGRAAPATRSAQVAPPARPVVPSLFSSAAGPFEPEGPKERRSRRDGPRPRRRSRPGN
ncbi:hypothetical protein [Streptomyces genisteinicus]|uniref:Uncharacterized protein n=1 Tax=Streptomyces genisteinicus TaxID=2768068 RepID=A0A7H0I2B9_9ACTN|nr:hypothetical protein [Streptomyces genisteinicus]QNP66935.1 hypothetical protein IAG43_31125 [Streptomyces genisteinicus]